MKSVFKVLTFLLLAALPTTLLAQNATLVIEYMKVTQESESTYLEVEKAWTKIHQKRIEEGLSMGWQLWKNSYAGYGDEYQYITINWYKDWAHSFTPLPEGFFDQFFNGEDAEIFAKTVDSRILVAKDVVRANMQQDDLCIRGHHPTRNMVEYAVGFGVVVGIPAKAVTKKADSEKPGFAAYGATGDGLSDPAAKAIDGLMENLQFLAARVEELEKQIERSEKKGEHLWPTEEGTEPRASKEID